MNSLVWLIPALPFSAFVINIFFGKKTGEKAGLIAVAASLLACAVGLTLINPLLSGKILAASFPWFEAGKTMLRFGYSIDPLAATLLFVVLTAGTLIQIYSIGYMHGDPLYSRFFAYVSLFMSAMLLLVISDNYLLFFIAWEIMGLCSYLLIGYWFEKNSAADASLKAFLTTRIGDVGFFLGILAVFFITGTLNFTEVARVLDPHVNAGILQNPLLPIAALLIFCGTIGKSAQFPLHVWLPDAMEGPTSVSALIHAAT
ncbi:MAG: NADH-quinone oxidoreductase subunit L, partial [Candidatus Omnitrophica bacterium]|nr:NADH-quinone oxidoreductase subunit L [Candidatus Omnitrophota bacterium]